MIPDTGFLPQVKNTSLAMVNNFLPVAHEATYVDSTRRGKPILAVARTAGFSEKQLIVGAFTFTVILRQRGTHGVVLIDRLE